MAGKPSSHGKRIRGHRGVALRKRRMERTGWLCEDCTAEGVVRQATIVDHIVPLALGGEDIDENTRNLCDHHNTVRTAEQFNRMPKLPTGLDGWPVQETSKISAG